MMPVSQLVVLVSYNFWVQLVCSFFAPEDRIKRERRENSWKVKIVAEKITQEEAQGEMKGKIAIAGCVLNYRLRQMCNICPFFGKCTPTKSH